VYSTVICYSAIRLHSRKSGINSVSVSNHDQNNPPAMHSTQHRRIFAVTDDASSQISIAVCVGGELSCRPSGSIHLFYAMLQCGNITSCTREGYIGDY